MRSLNVGVIGAGFMGQRHIRTYLSRPNCSLIGIVEQDDAKLKDLRDAFSVPVYKDLSYLLDDVDAVSIATPASTHYELAKFLLENKKHVLLEKPMAYTTSQAWDLIKTARVNNVILAIGHIERFNPVVDSLCELIRREQPLFIEIHREGPYDPRIFDVDVIMDFMIHDLDLLVHLFEDRLVLKSAYGISVFSDKTDVVNAQLVEKNGMLINVTSSRASEQRKRQWRLLFHNKTIEIDLFNRKISCFNKKDGLTRNISDHYSSVDPLTLEIDDFLKSVIGGSRPTVDGTQGFNALFLSEKIQTAVNRQNSDLMAI
ncbi:Gfo/Idh/MocA family oxidoreductase [Paenibacillus tritici]|uniref:Gfo/Idh/MocA family protein n=1 Tax=Paenibacillus tritici TaxID=1873425 RepID=UPI001BAB479D|nr:Gfo/Idh/MocA family oxidoreductase [Paenibacillus tritici]QUL57070.1 Gfo/Idh/MocA family oxidoreductase [Paenibacillus tritici]